MKPWTFIYARPPAKKPAQSCRTVAKYPEKLRWPSRFLIEFQSASYRQMTRRYLCFWDDYLLISPPQRRRRGRFRFHFIFDIYSIYCVSLMILCTIAMTGSCCWYIHMISEHTYLLPLGYQTRTRTYALLALSPMFFILCWIELIRSY